MFMLCSLWMSQQMVLLFHMDNVKIVKSLCLLWMPEQMDLLHMDIVKTVKVYVMFAMDASTDGLVVAHGHCYNFVVVLL